MNTNLIMVAKNLHGVLGALSLLVAGLPCSSRPAELGRFEIQEPLGVTWTGEWLTQEMDIDLGRAEIKGVALQLKTDAGQALPAQFYSRADDMPVADADRLTGRQSLKVLFRATVAKRSKQTFHLCDDGQAPRSWPQVRVTGRNSAFVVGNGVYELEFEANPSLPVNALRLAGPKVNLGSYHWPQNLRPCAVANTWLELGPARGVLRRTFSFPNPAHHYEITFDIRAGDPWIDVTDSGSLGKGSAIEIDLRDLAADTVYHPHTYNARTFKPDGQAEDSTLAPPQHPVATLGPIWRDIWYGGGPFAFVYRTDADGGLGLVAVRGSEWKTRERITPESQNLEVHGDQTTAGLVRVRIPTDGVIRRRWALIPGPPALRQSLSRLVRSHADIPFDMVRHEWILDWKSDAPEFKGGGGGIYLGGHFNQHFFNPTTYPRSVRGQVDRALKKFRHVKSTDLAVLAYVFTNPNYWPGPDYPWQIGNPNFHTDMYNIPLKIGLLMPDHPHAGRWVAFGVKETYGNLMRDSYPGGAWAESLSYSSFFFHVVEHAKLLREYGITNGFEAWPRLREVATYLAAMHTPEDPRYGSRQKAPIGDTSPGHYIRELNHLGEYCSGGDDLFARQMRRFPEQWEHAFDLGSREFPGFGAMLRGNPYDTRHESFVTVKAGPARNHYQGDELSFHFCGLGTPLAIDHACHYSPRPWSASIHNRPDMNNKRPVAVAEPRAFVRDPTSIHRLQGGPAAIGNPRAFQASAVADVFVADERTTRINEVPLEPHLAVKPGWEYPTTYLPEDQAWIMRRYVMLVKHDPVRSKFADYLAIRDEIISPEPVWWNLHLLARAIEGDGPIFRFPGQLEVDLTAHFLTPAVSAIEKREWGWSGNSGKRRSVKGSDYERQHFGQFIPRDFARGTRKSEDGERTVWLRVRGDAGTTRWLVVLMPHWQGQSAPRVERLSATSARVTVDGETEVIHLGTDGAFQAAVERGGVLHCLLEADRVNPLSEVSFQGLPDRTDRGGM